MRFATVAHAADSTNMITWSISGSTAMRNFTSKVSGGLTTLETGAGDLTLSNGVYSGDPNGIQLAPTTFTGTAIPGGSSLPPPATPTVAAGVRVEWHEAGSVEGILEMANDQIGYSSAPIVDAFTPRNPTGGNPIWINRTSFSGVGTNPTTNFGIATSAYNTYSAADYNAAGTNLQGGQNRVQMAISDVVPLQGFSNSGSGSYTSSYTARPGDVGYGKGNTLLGGANNLAGLGQTGVRQQLVDGSVLNMSTDKINPQTGLNYGTGAWNSGTVSNLTSKTVAITATVFAANPGTGLTDINKTNAQWLQTTGRLENGVDFNMTERDPNSGTRNVAALNTGVDPSWAVGEDDGGNGYGAGSAGTLECAIGPTMRFSGKTAGGGLLRPTVQNNRMALGVLSMSDAIGAVKSNTNANPLRALAYSDTVDGQTDNAVQPTTATITNGTYVIWQKEQYVTVNTPDANYGNGEFAKGDPNGDIVKLRDNVLNSVTNFPNQLSLNDAADQLIAQSFLLPQFMTVDKATDGGAVTGIGSITAGSMTHDQWRAAALVPANGVTTNFDTLAASSVTAGSSSLYGVVSGVTSIGFTGGSGVNVAITAEDSSGALTGAAAAPRGNYLFGNFNQNGVRDFSAIQTAAIAQCRSRRWRPTATALTLRIHRYRTIPKCSASTLC